MHGVTVIEKENIWIIDTAVLGNARGKANGKKIINTRTGTLKVNAYGKINPPLY